MRQSARRARDVVCSNFALAPLESICIPMRLCFNVTDLKKQASNAAGKWGLHAQGGFEIRVPCVMQQILHVMH